MRRNENIIISFIKLTSVKYSYILSNIQTEARNHSTLVSQPFCVPIMRYWITYKEKFDYALDIFQYSTIKGVRETRMESRS